MLLDDYLTLAKTVEILKVHPMTLNHMIREGQLRRHQVKGRRGHLFRKSEVYALHEARTQRLDLASVAAMSIRAHVTSKTCERVLEQLLHVMGIDSETLSHNEPDVLSLYVSVKDATVQEDQFEADEIKNWSRVFIGITEEYLDLVKHYTSNQEPWKPYLDLAARIARSRKPSEVAISMDLKIAYGTFDYARRQLRSVAYFYVRGQHGKKTATSLFPETGDIHEEILSFAML